MSEGSGSIAYIDKWITSGILDCSYWCWYGNKNNFNIGHTVFSFFKKYQMMNGYLYHQLKF